MMRIPHDSAIKTAIELAKVNIESTQAWVKPEDVNFFIEQVYNLLTGEKKTDQ